MATGKLIDVPLQVFVGELVEGALVDMLQHAPEGLNPVGVNLAPDVLTDAVSDALVVVRHALIGAGVVCVDYGFGCDVLADEALQGFSVRNFDHGRANLVRSPVLYAHDRRLSYRAAPLQVLPPSLGHVLAASADVGRCGPSTFTGPENNASCSARQASVP